MMFLFLYNSKKRSTIIFLGGLLIYLFLLECAFLFPGILLFVGELGLSRKTLRFLIVVENLAEASLSRGYSYYIFDYF